MPCTIDTGYLKTGLLYAIWNNPCIAYSKIRSQVESSIKKYEGDARQTEENKKRNHNKGDVIDSQYFEIDSSYLPKNALKEPIWWW
jgi:hypothetical protein